jgi:undecaprenyl diphosphate synthase
MHVAIIMDGNGRWAQQRGLARAVGHRAGAKAARRIVEAAVRSTVDTLTLYAFSSDNWSRPADEVGNLMRLMKRYLVSETAKCLENGVRVCVIGRRDRLSRDLLETIERTEEATAGCDRLQLQLAVDYSSRMAIMQAAQTAGGAFEERLAQAIHAPARVPNVDLLIRTGGERRLSDFLLWECAYAELVFSNVFWPEFDEQAFAAALREFRGRMRRFGGLSSHRAGERAAEQAL